MKLLRGYCIKGLLILVPEALKIFAVVWEFTQLDGLLLPYWQVSGAWPGQGNCLTGLEKLSKMALVWGVDSNNKCNGILVIVIFDEYLIGRCKTQCFAWHRARIDEPVW